MSRMEWYQENIKCYVDSNGSHNFTPVSFVKSAHLMQATMLMCTHCLQIIELKDVQEFNHEAMTLCTSDNA